MAENLPSPAQSRPPILAPAEADRRLVLLSTLQNALSTQGLSSVLVRNHRLVLRSDDRPQAPSGPTDPQLHIFNSNGTEIATTDGRTYHFVSDREHPADDAAAAAKATRHRLLAQQRT